LPKQQEDTLNSDTLTDRVIAVDYGTSLPAMIAAGKYDWTNPDITAARFPVVGTGTKRYRTKLFDFGRRISSEDAVSAMKAENFTPADHAHGLAYGAAYPGEQRRNPIACLGSCAQVYGYRSVVCLSRGVAERLLNLHGWSGDWGGFWRFLAVQEVSDKTQSRAVDWERLDRYSKKEEERMRDELAQFYECAGFKRY